MDAPALTRLGLLAAVIALLPLSWWWLRQRGKDTRARLAALAALTLFLTFDLVVFGAFTRLTDSGLGCPDWPGCYGHASPIGAAAAIQAAQQALPSGPVTWSKAWIEMVHRYLAMAVGVLIVVMAAAAWAQRLRRTVSLPLSPWWPTATLLWVVVQGLFGKYTVTLKLYPAVVTLHLLGGLVLLALLARQHAAFSQRPLPLSDNRRKGAVAALAVLALQIALGGWVSSNYAVLACTGFPQCNGQAWPTMDVAAGFTLLRGLGEPGGGALSLAGLVAIHMAHRLFAVVAAVVIAALAWQLWRSGRGSGRGSKSSRNSDGAAPTQQRFGIALGLLLLAQLASGLSNVVLGWPLPAALAHSAGAAALVLSLVLLLARSAEKTAVGVPRRAAAAA